MRSSARLVLLPWFALLALAVWSSGPGDPPTTPEGESQEGGRYPSDWFGLQRAFPGSVIPQEKFEAAVQQAGFDRVSAESGFSTASSLDWVQAGPYNIGGRVAALAVEPGGTNVYLGAAAGGVFKSTDSGAHWTPVFDQVYSIGALALDPSNPNICYVGTGESNSAIDNYDGAGVFRTTDGGATWQSLGLEATARIGAIEVDPQNPNRIFVAAMGRQFSTSPERGFYRSEDGGVSWTRTLFVNDSTGVIDIAVNPAHPETVYCATWERVRRLTYRRAYGPGCGIWRSVDHGGTWTRLQNGLPVPSDNVGRIALGIAPSRPSTIYAQIGSGAAGGYVGLGLYRTQDGGDTWTKRDASATFTNSFGSFVWYFGEMGVDPVDPDVIYTMGVQMLRSNDGGVSYLDLTPLHVDQHAIWIDPANSARIYVGNDGGFYSTPNTGGSWIKSLDLPITQFYAGTIDPSNPSRLLGGTQDNNTLLSPVGSPTNWTSILGGDGFQCIVDPTNPNIIFAEWQNCCDRSGPRRSTTGGGGWSGASGFMLDRYNWNSPITMSALNHNVLLVGSHRVYKSVNNGLSYFTVSGDLTTNPMSPLTFGTITTLAISPVDSATYYAGTDDGRVWRSTNSGGNWTNISAGLPVRYVTRVTPDPVSAAVVYVTLSGFGIDEHLAHVYRSDSRGDSWVSIAGNLPDVPANDVLVDPIYPQTLYLATDVGVYSTVNGGAAWFPLGNGMPIQTVFDLSFHPGSRMLAAATHGRSQWTLMVGSAPLAVRETAAPPQIQLSGPRPQPSRGAVRLELELPRATSLDVAIYDAGGRRVRALASGSRAAGRQALTWDGTDDRGRTVAPGVFFVRANAGGAIATRRVIRVR
jgi:photosystem II stability/assembly factor-like uncharacterized protein